ncbi:MAG: hypothetical protein KGY75_04845 [Candidatus Cloacimonetes bacterium]|nr:hypothetical protein [Candidatus Cloacimonadota bacterium]MBS3767427.1 hypothetical protein [Candidatus Cloacimonadota bacterium]
MASIYVSSRTKNVIIILVVVFSVLFAFVKSDIWNVTMRPGGKQGTSPKQAVKIFEEAKFAKKSRLSLVPRNLKDYEKLLDEIVEENDLNVIFRKETKNNLCEIIRVPQEKYDDILSPLLNSSVLETSEMIGSGDYMSVEDLKSRIEGAELIRDKIQKDLSKTINPYTSKDLQKNLRQQRNVVDSLKQTLQLRKARQGLVLTKIDMNKYFDKAQQIKSAAKTFAITFAISFVVLTIILLVIYLILIILSKLFNVLGIKSFNKGSSKYSRYGGGYGYGSYGYGQKKVKRIYKRKSKSEDEDEKEKNDGEEK